MGINAGHLGGGVSPQAHHAARELVNEFEGLKIERFASACEQRFKVLQQRRHDQLIAIAAGHVQQVST